jgi:hypothetical protein
VYGVRHVAAEPPQYVRAACTGAAAKPPPYVRAACSGAAAAAGRRRAARGGGGARRTRFPPEKHICDLVLSISELEMLSTPSLNLRGVQVQIFKEHMSK